jgi:23S rRNA (uracil1939-C5)-methyltransferase
MLYSKSMIIGEFFTALVERIAVGGSGVLHYQGQSIFMDTTAPGDLVVGRIREEHKGWAKAELVEILEASPNRTSPLCPHYEVCGGCSLQHLSYEAQVAEKSAILQDALVRIGGLAALPNLQIYSSPPFEYRNRVQFHRINRPGMRHWALRLGRVKRSSPWMIVSSQIRKSAGLWGKDGSCCP